MRLFFIGQVGALVGVSVFHWVRLVTEFGFLFGTVAGRGADHVLCETGL